MDSSNFSVKNSSPNSGSNIPNINSSMGSSSSDQPIVNQPGLSSVPDTKKRRIISFGKKGSSTVGDNQSGSGLTPQNTTSTKNSKLDPKMILISLFGVIVSLGIIFAVMFFVSDNNSTGFKSPVSRDLKPNENRGSEEMVQNPLTGEFVGVAASADWINNRPMGAMINNAVPARMQSGLVDADVVYEIVAEGGITRFLAFFLSETPEKIGPIRSARHYYLVLVKEMGDAMIMHIGWSPQALEAIETWPVRSLTRGGASFTRDQERLDAGIATEHTAYVSGPDLRALGDDLGWEGKDEDFVSWSFKEDAPIQTSGAGIEAVTVGSPDPISIDFWERGDYSAVWEYVPETNTYIRYMGYDAEDNPIPHIDQETSEQIEVKNVIVQYVVESAIEGDDKSRLDYELVGSGEGLVFLDGTVKQVTWTKEDRDSRTMFYDTNGEEVEFNRGRFWISMVPDRNKDQVVY